MYKVTETNDIMAASQFETTSRCMAINNDSIYRAAEGKLEVVNMAGKLAWRLCGRRCHASGHSRPHVLMLCKRNGPPFSCQRSRKDANTLP